MKKKSIIILGGSGKMGINFSKSLASAGAKVILGDLNKNEEKIYFNKNKPICILIGPEGDFSENERELMSQLQNIRSLRINRNILRTETAAIAMISILTSKHLS